MSETEVLEWQRDMRRIRQALEKIAEHLEAKDAPSAAGSCECSNCGRPTSCPACSNAAL
jgi:hypothetical protein